MRSCAPDVPSAMNTRDFVDFARSASTSFCAGNACQAFTKASRAIFKHVDVDVDDLDRIVAGGELVGLMPTSRYSRQPIAREREGAWVLIGKLRKIALFEHFLSNFNSLNKMLDCYYWL